ncbi:hypothetical protein [Roseomonas xinghualingensis]|uniref:hypothetical protein n=1 Tax=Roseomonas xinghualingensis TaxID=2986475 RepID=UPI0021F2032C|nr:hypothetical protein [Roseomonas sp. SXEYE001]MCV4206896.1 hypothetical protein [Roseomonas sp. SXEYE001]
MTKQWTIEELKLAFPDVAFQCRMEMFMATCHAERVTAVEKAIDHVAQNLTRTRHHRQHKDEDLLTNDIVTSLKDIGFQASHDTDIGGHCDVVVEGRENFLWLGEAKTHHDYDWLYKGFQQLSTRYSGGMPGQEAGGLIIYCYNQGVAQMMSSWKQHLVTQRPDIQTITCTANPLAFRSTHLHEVSGLSYMVRHIPVALYFDPKDAVRAGPKKARSPGKARGTSAPRPARKAGSSAHSRAIKAAPASKK